MKRRQKVASQVWPLRPDSALIGRAVDLYVSVRTAACQDEFTEESFLFAFLVEYERFGHSLLHPAEARERLLNELRAEILNDMGRGGPTVEQLAADSPEACQRRPVAKCSLVWAQRDDRPGERKWLVICSYEHKLPCRV